MDPVVDKAVRDLQAYGYSVAVSGDGKETVILAVRGRRRFALVRRTQKYFEVYPVGVDRATGRMRAQMFENGIKFVTPEDSMWVEDLDYDVVLLEEERERRTAEETAW